MSASRLLKYSFSSDLTYELARDIKAENAQAPLPKGPPAEESNTLAGKNFANLPRRIMVVDDSADAAQVLCMLMETLGHECQTVFDSTKALEIAKHYKPEFVFLDLGMPGVDGYALCRQMRELPELALTVFIAETGWSDKDHMDRAREAGFQHHLVKPIGVKEIEAVLTQRSAAN